MAAAYVLETSHAAIAVTESAGLGPPVLLIHGNSSCKEVFRHQLEGAIGARHRLIAIDLPGHGRSSNARNPRRSYTIPGYADVAVEVMDRLGIGRFAVLGWSLGGHAALDLLCRHAGVAGVMITGTPPVANTPESFAAGFKVSEHMGLTAKRDLTPGEAEAYARATCGEPFDPMLLDAVKRTDGLARETMFAAALAGWNADQLRIVETSDRPIAVVSGADEPFVDNTHLQGLGWANLWDNRVHILDGLGHAPFWQAPERFDPLLERFLADLFP